MSLLPPLHFGWQIAGHSRKLSQASLRGLLACCVEWSPGGGLTNTPVEHWCRRWTSRSTVCCINIVWLVTSRRDMGWWRHAQTAHTRLKDTWSERGPQSTPQCMALENTSGVFLRPCAPRTSRRKTLVRGGRTNGTLPRDATEHFVSTVHRENTMRSLFRPPIGSMPVRPASASVRHTPHSTGTRGSNVGPSAPRSLVLGLHRRPGQ